MLMERCEWAVIKEMVERLEQGSRVRSPSYTSASLFTSRRGKVDRSVLVQVTKDCQLSIEFIGRWAQMPKNSMIIRVKTTKCKTAKKKLEAPWLAVAVASVAITIFRVTTRSRTIAVSRKSVCATTVVVRWRRARVITSSASSGITGARRPTTMATVRCLAGLVSLVRAMKRMSQLHTPSNTPKTD